MACSKKAHDIKKMEMYRIIVHNLNNDSIVSGIIEALDLRSHTDEDAILNGLNIESMPIREQVECIFSDGESPEIFPIYFSKMIDGTIRMSNAWFRFVEKKEGCNCNECGK